MSVRRGILAHVALCSILSCGGEPSAKHSNKKPPASCKAPSRVVDGTCLEPGVQDDGCLAGTLGLGDGTCAEAGVPPELCGDGFSPGDHGCDPILPARPCGAGQLAVPGDTACHDVMPCGRAPWGDIPADATTQFVDATYAGADSDGTKAKPWTTIAAALSAAPEGGLVAIAAGSYAETLIVHKRVRIWGRCPAEVELTGPPNDAALVLESGSGGSEVHGLAFAAGYVGIVVTGAKDVILDRIWAHDTAFSPIQLHNVAGPVSASLRDSLIEGGMASGLFVTAGELVVERSVVRGTRVLSGFPFAAAVFAQDNVSPVGSSTLTLRRSVVEDNEEFGVMVGGSQGVVEGSVVRNTRPNASKQHGRGIQVQVGAKHPGILDGKSTVVTDNVDAGVYVLGATATLEGMTIRRTTAVPAGIWGQGIAVWDAHPEGSPSTATVRSSLVEDNQSVGTLVVGSTATLEGVLVRRTQPEPASQSRGNGIQVQADVETSVPAAAALRGVVSDDNPFAGILVLNADLSLDGALVTSTQPIAADGSFGDALMMVESVPAELHVTASVLRGSARAGLSLFGGTATLATSVLECNPIDLDLEVALTGPVGALSDEGSNRCGCETNAPCRALTSGIAPPVAIGR